MQTNERIFTLYTVLNTSYILYRLTLSEHRYDVVTDLASAEI